MLSCERNSSEFINQLVVPTVNMLSPNSLVCWLNMRVVTMDVGRRFSMRISIISSFFLAISFTSGLFLALSLLGLISVQLSNAVSVYIGIDFFLFKSVLFVQIYNGALVNREFLRQKEILMK